MQDQHIEIGSQSLAVWPQGLKFKALDPEGTIVRTHFPDIEAYHPVLRAALEAELARPETHRQYGRSMGGTKIYRLERWNDPAMRLLNARAVELFKHATGAEGGVIDMGWANVYGRGDYIVAHSHWRSQGSVVYMFDEGDDGGDDGGEAGDQYAGRFSFIDPRLSLCCGMQPGLMTHPASPVLRPGAMMVFPSQLVHTVNPYAGTRPRITLSWNINREALEGDTLALLNQPQT